MKESVNWKNDLPKYLYFCPDIYRGIVLHGETVRRLDINLNRALEDINNKKNHKATFKEMIAE